MDIHDAILDYLYNFPLKVSELISPDASENLNREPLGIDRELLINELVYLCEAGLVTLRECSELEAKKCINENEQIVVSMTNRGGEQWESVFKPNWKNYTNIVCELLEEEPHVKVDLECGDRAIIRNMILDIGEDVFIEPIGEILKIQPWHPVYWKTLSNGYSVSFKMFEDYVDLLGEFRGKTKWKHGWKNTNNSFIITNM
ncbi:MAG: hypothetical protein JAY90_18695 [Candidatus Thiodiazotropha lotti]|nr:hypothetical protein [Candidatus Thiodiazotropha lotti]